MTDKPQAPDLANDSEAERRFNETLGRLVNTPHKPHKTKLKALEPRLRALPDRLQPAKKTQNKTGAKGGKTG